jgi:DNA-binding NtrC family response regulator
MVSSLPSHQGDVAPAQQRTSILVVEDEIVIRTLISDVLRDEGYVVIEACNGDEAVGILNAGISFDLVFSDVRMPGSCDGIALLELLRHHFPNLPVIMTSGHLEPRRAMARGATNFLAKPYDLGAVVALIANELGNIK